MMPKKVLLTGATGLLGSNVAAELLARGCEIRVLLRRSSHLTALKGLDVELFYGDITNAQDVSAAAKGCEWLIHAAANTSQWGRDMHLHNAVNLQGTQHVLDAVKRRDVARLIHVSTANVFRPGSVTQPGDEMGAFSYNKHSTDYIDSKYQAQQLVLHAVAKENVPAIIVNPTFMIGARDAKPSSGKMLLYYLKTPIVVCPPGGKNFVPVQDAVIGIVNAALHGRVGECYLLAGANLTYKAFFKQVEILSGRKKLIIQLSKQLLTIAGRTGDAVSKMTGKKNALSYTNSQMLMMDNYYTAQKAVQELGMPQTPLTDAIADAIEWFQEHGYI